MQLICYELLTSRSRKTLVASGRKWGRSRFDEKPYRPRAKMVRRLARILGWSEKQVIDQLCKERAYLRRMENL